MNVIDPKSLSGNAGHPSYFSGAVTLRPMPTEGADPVKLIRVEFASEEQYGR
jgi:hypothetical protein